jgi:allantoinase
MALELAVRSRRVAIPNGVAAATVVVAGGRIVELRPFDDPPRRVPLDDWGDVALLPGVVDTHVHVDEPGRADWEGFASATAAAAAGGVTTMVDMPLNSIPPTTSVAALAAKRIAARGQCRVDVGFWGGAVPGNSGDLAALAAGGVLGFKAFLAPSGVPEFAHLSFGDLVDAARQVARLGSVLLAHAEWPPTLEAAAAAGDPRSHATWEATRPPAAEAEAIAQLAAVAHATGARIHVVHVASEAALEALDAAREAGLPLSGETCPHYLTFASEEIPDGATEYKCAPPLRGRRERESLWDGLARGTLELVASDHSPSPPALKRHDTGDFLAAWGGIASLQVALAALWTGARARGFGLADLARWTAAAPARLAGLEGRKGAIAIGRDADLVAFDADASFTVDPETLYHRHRLTPYAGRALEGVVRRTYLRGARVFDEGAGVAAEAAGELLERGRRR